MKKWRVGTLSMGLSLIMLGAGLFASQWKGLQAFDSLIGWWPIVLVLLGLEIVIYLFASRKDNPVMYYDVFSILFVGALCAASLGFAMLTSLGIVNEVRGALHSVERTLELPEVKQELASGTGKIVIVTNGMPVKVDKSASSSVQLFGSYKQISRPEGTDGKLQGLAPVTADEFCTVRTVGDTMYVQLKPLPVERGWRFRSSYPMATVTAVVPQDKQIELRGYNNQVIPEP